MFVCGRIEKRNVKNVRVKELRKYVAGQTKFCYREDKNVGMKGTKVTFRR